MDELSVIEILRTKSSYIYTSLTFRKVSLPEPPTPYLWSKTAGTKLNTLHIKRCRVLTHCWDLTDKWNKLVTAIQVVYAKTFSRLHLVLGVMKYLLVTLLCLLHHP